MIFSKLYDSLDSLDAAWYAGIGGQVVNHQPPVLELGVLVDLCRGISTHYRERKSLYAAEHTTTESLSG